MQRVNYFYILVFLCFYVVSAGCEKSDDKEGEHEGVYEGYLLTLYMDPSYYGNPWRSVDLEKALTQFQVTNQQSSEEVVLVDVRSASQLYWEWTELEVNPDGSFYADLVVSHCLYGSLRQILYGFITADSMSLTIGESFTSPRDKYDVIYQFYGLKIR